MAAQIPEARSLATWEDAFQHPLPVVRKLEQQLRRNIEENRQKLRSLVGASYRDLLGTAERIVEMDEQIQSVEAHLGDMGRKCNARMVERIGTNYGRLSREKSFGAPKVASERGTEHARHRIMAQTKVLQNTLAVTSQIIKSGGDALLASKLLVLARLLQKSVSDSGDAPAILEELSKKLRTTRKKLLAYIGRSLVRSDADKTATLQILCAYALLSSSSPRDVLRYFLQIRFAQLETRFESPSNDNLLEALELFRQTLADTRELFPKRFAEALSQVSDIALVRDASVRAVFQLNLDIYEQWIPDDVRKFMPWTHHEQVLLSEVKDALASWTRQAQKCLLQGLTEALESQNDPRNVLDLRQKVLAQYLSISVKYHDEGHTRTITDLRSVFLARLESLAVDTAQLSLSHLVPTTGHEEVQATSTIDLWSIASTNIDTSKGALGFRDAVVQKQYGRTDSVRNLTASLDAWIQRLDSINDIVTSLRATKWDDDLDLDLDDLDDGESILIALNKQDPQALAAKLQATTQATLRANFSDLEADPLAPTSDAALQLRLLRELDMCCKRLQSAQFASLEGIHPDHKVLSKLHRRIVVEAAAAALDQYAETASLSITRRVSVALWDGSPPLPIQPSTATFRFLTVLHKRMGMTGTDVWTREAVRSAKDYLADELVRREILSLPTDQVSEQNGVGKESTESLETSAHPDKEDADANGETSDVSKDSVSEHDASETTPSVPGHAKSDEQLRNHLLQRTFDALYLQRILDWTQAGSTSTTVAIPLQGNVDALTQHLELDTTMRERLRKNANDYWRRTYLLFGLLAG